MSWNSVLNVFKKIWFFGEISNKYANGLFGTNVNKTKITKDKNGENVSHLEITELVLIHCNIDGNHH